MEQLIFIKLGGSVITHKDKPLTANERAIQRLGREIIEAKKKFGGKIIIGHGSGSFGHSLASKYKTHEGIVNKESVKGAVLVEDVAVQLNRIVVRQLLGLGLPVFSFAPGSFLTSRTRKPDKVFPEAIFQALEKGIIPLVYGDVVFDERIGFTIFSTEMVFDALIKHLLKQYKIVRIIHASDTNGVYGRDGKTIPIITPKNFDKVQKAVVGSKAVDVTGGMLHKVKESLGTARRFGIESIILNGTISGELKRAIIGGEVEGTIIHST